RSPFFRISLSYDGAASMGPSTLWLPPLLIALSLMLLSPGANAQIARTMRHSCSGSANQKALTHSMVNDRFDDLRAIYENCTRILGNVEITYLNTTNVGNRTLDFLDDIEEVKGYVLIFHNDLERISFKKLKIIWGDNLYDSTALYIQHNTLKSVSMPRLLSVEKGRIYVANTHDLCHLKKKVNLNEILNYNKSRITWDLKQHCLDKRSITCHPKCKGECWGPLEEDCQTVYRSLCPKDFCESNQCFSDSETNQTRCCHAQCVGGCTGPSSKDCTFCSGFKQCTNNGKPNEECKCVDQCTSRRKYNPQTGQVEPNPDGFYSMDNRYCEKECPEERLVQDDVCVEYCSPGMHYDFSKGDRICRKCEGPCPVSCKFKGLVDADTIKLLQNCSEIEGNLQFNVLSFRGHPDPVLGLEKRKVSAMAVSELDVLKSVRFISEYLYVATNDANLKSLSFLENLEYIGGRSLYGAKQSLVISQNDNLEYLGLRKLKKIAKGDIIISKNYEACYVDSFNWTDIVTGVNAKVAVLENRRVCVNESRICDSSCDPAFGCWGPTNADCRKCVHWLQEGHCVDKCSSRGFFENHETRNCDRCYVECDTCKGPEHTDCLTCRSYKLYRKHGSAPLSPLDFDDDFITVEEQPKQPRPVSHLVETDTTNAASENTLPPSEQPSKFTQLTCVADCPSTRYYVENNECKRCHRSCYDLGCNGPSNEPGPLGCKKCKYAQIDPPVGNSTLGAVARCLFNSLKVHANTVCMNNDLLDHFVQSSTHPDVVEEFECAPCDEECSTCQSKGNSRITNKCKCRHFVAYMPFHRMGGVMDTTKEDEKCVPGCTKGLYTDNATSEVDIEGVCRMCHNLCDRFGENGPHCTGTTHLDCIKCSPSAFSYRNGSSLTCVKNCAELNLFTYHKEKGCFDTDYDTRDKVHRAALYILAALFLVVVLIIGLMLWRRQKRLSKELEQEKVANNPEMPELIPMDHNARINKERFLLIPKQALSRSARELGSGAFGVVYAGCWMPVSKAGKPTKVPVAIKVVRDPSGRAQSEMLDEAAKMTMMRHENLLRIVGVCLSGDDLQLVTLLRPLGNLREFLQKHKGKLSGKELLQYSYQIASGMKYLTDQRVVHRDLAARNVLVKNIHHVEITDFGLAKLIDIGADSVQVGEGKVAIKWLALEALEKQVYNTATDVWAFGVTVWEILTYGESPYANMTPMAIKEYLLSGQRLAQPNNCSTELYKHLIDCWLPYPDSRPTFAVLKENLYKYCKAPWHFVYDVDLNSEMELDNCSQLGLIEQILDETGFEDPQNYFDSEPNTPGCANTSDMFNPMGVRRMDSLGSQRYAQDPTDRRKEIGMADDNYLVPNSQATEIGATMYTPVVVDESGNSSLVESLGYYNEVKPGAEYINDTQPLKKPLRNSRDDRLSAIEEDDDFGNIEKESCL
ncbi:let-23, partial [Pristionchus pacificus]